MSRPTKLTPEIARKMIEILRGGLDLETAAACVRVSPKTAQRWLERGRAAKGGPLCEFALDADQATAQADMFDILLVGKAAKSDWRAAAWRAERRRPEKWGKRPGVEVEAATADEKAAEIRAALREMDESVEPPPKQAAGEAPKPEESDVAPKAP